MKKIIILIVLSILLLFNIDGFCQQYVKSFKQITFDNTVDYYPRWSPDGNFIAYSARGTEECNVLKISSHGEKAHRITNIHSGHPSWSPGGIYISFDNFGKGIVQVVSELGGTPIQVIPDNLLKKRNRYSCWSSDGSKIAFSSNGEIYSVDLSIGGYNLIYHREGFYARPFCWMQNGDMLIDLSDTDGKDGDIWLISSEDKEIRKVTDFPGREANPHFSPDGSMVVFMSEHGGNQDIWIVSSKGGEPVQMTTHPGRDMTPHWSLDGNKIAFARETGGNRDIWIMEIDVQAIKKKLRITE